MLLRIMAITVPEVDEKTLVSAFTCFSFFDQNTDDVDYGGTFYSREVFFYTVRRIFSICHLKRLGKKFVLIV